MKEIASAVSACIFLSACAAGSFNRAGGYVEVNPMVRNKITRSRQYLEKGDILLSRKWNDRALAKLVSNKETFSEEEYEYLHSELAFLRLSSSYGRQGGAGVIESDIFPLIFNSRVEVWKNYFTTRGREHFSRYLERAGLYIREVKDIFREEGLPRDLAYVAIIESGFYPFARSSAGAVGIWQFMESTARMKGLKIDYWVDERRDPLKSTRAAASYLKMLYEEFGSWEMALAAYNYGPTAVRRQIRRWGTDDYWEIYLPRETEEFIPKIMAAIFIAREPALFGFEEIIPSAPEYNYYTLSGAVDLREIARLSGVDIRQIQLLNPELRRMATPPGIDYSIRIPAESFDRFAENFQNIPESSVYLSEDEINRRIRRVEFHRVRRGENLWTISRRYNVSIENIKRWNNLSTSRIFPDQRLKLYIRGS